MPFTDLADYKAGLTHATQQTNIINPITSVTSGRTMDLWAFLQPAGVAPTTAVVPTRTTQGALNFNNSTTGSLFICGSNLYSISPGTYLVCDRLSHQGGLSGTVTTPQTTNLATAALTRYTDGIGVMIGLTIYTQIGATGTTVSVSYTDQDNNAGSTSPLVVFGGTGFREAGRIIQIPLVIGDYGVKSVESVTVTVTTGTAGNFGVTLYKPLYALIIDDVNGNSIINLIDGKSLGGIPEIIDDSCLFIMSITSITNSNIAGNLLLAER